MVCLPFWDLCSSRSTLHFTWTSLIILPSLVSLLASLFQPSFSTCITPLSTPTRKPAKWILPRLPAPGVQARPLLQARTPEAWPEPCGRWPGTKSTQPSHLLDPPLPAQSKEPKSPCWHRIVSAWGEAEKDGSLWIQSGKATETPNWLLESRWKMEKRKQRGVWRGREGT